jgi:hypothetical protein
MELLFLQVISMFQVAAMQQLGKIVDPTTGEVTRDLTQAKISIDILDVLKQKTKGNLTDVEGELLDKVLFELHMNYVDELKTSEKAEGEEGGAEGEKENAEAPGDGVEKEKEEGQRDG